MPDTVRPAANVAQIDDRANSVRDAADREQDERGWRDLGLDVRLVEGGVGQASALKLSYAMLGKGVTALGTAMMLAADRAGVSADLCRELEASQPALLAYLQRQVPGMLPKAYRWVAEMEEIAGFLGTPGAGSPIYDGAARVYERIARAVGGDGEEPAVLGAFLKRCGP